MGNHVFICYASVDRDFVLRLAMNLKNRDIPIWLDQWDIPHGANWNKTRDNALYEAASCLVVLSPSAVDSEQVEAEWTTALEEKKLVVPLLYRSCRIPSRLRLIQRIDFISRGPDDVTALTEVERAFRGRSDSTLAETAVPPEEHNRKSTASDPPPSQSRLRMATDEEVRQFDPKVRQVSRAAEEQIRLSAPPASRPFSLLLVLLGLLVFVGGAVALYRYVTQKDKDDQLPMPPKQEEKAPAVATSEKGIEKPQQAQQEGRPQEPPKQPDPPAKQEKKPGPVLGQGATKEEKKSDESRQSDWMVSIPAGKFWMGCKEEIDKNCEDDEKPGHEAFLDAYSIDRYEVTVADYRQCVEGKGCTPPSTTSRFCNWGKSDRDNHPVNCVDWTQAQAYCQWAGKRLPTEAEWEKAARGDKDRRIYPWGNEWDANKANAGSSGTVLVGSYAAGVSLYKVYDMAGNVWEWVQDWYAEDYYQQKVKANPQGPEHGASRVVRGGSWLNGAWLLRVSDRFWVVPGFRLDFVGFRCAE